MDNLQYLEWAKIAYFFEPITKTLTFYEKYIFFQHTLTLFHTSYPPIILVKNTKKIIQPIEIQYIAKLLNEKKLK